MNKKLEMIPCPKCDSDFPKLRKELYNYHTCVECSTVEAVVGITTLEGSGDHTYNDLIIMDQKTARAIAERGEDGGSISSAVAAEARDSLNLAVQLDAGNMEYERDWKVV